VKNEISKDESLGNELSFPVREKKKRGEPLDARKLLLRFLLGYAVIAAVLMVARCTFFINARFAEGVVIDVRKSYGAWFFEPHVKFTAQNGEPITFTAARNLRVGIGEPVTVIYKRANPRCAAVYSFFGFWFNTLLAIQVLLMIWVVGLVTYYWDYR